MKRKPKKLKSKQVFPLFWKECCKCNSEFRFEKGFSDYSLGFKRCLCSDCAKDAEHAVTVFHELTRPKIPPRSK